MVHDFFSYEDKELNRLGSLEFFQTNTECTLFKEMIENELLLAASDIKNQKSEIASKILASIKELLHDFFNKLEPFFFDKNKALIVP